MSNLTDALIAAKLVGGSGGSGGGSGLPEIMGKVVIADASPTFVSGEEYPPGLSSADMPILNSNIAVGDDINVTWDGADYSGTLSDYNGMLVFGNQSLLGIGEDTGEPFWGGLFPDFGVQVLTTAPAGQHTVKITKADIEQLYPDYGVPIIESGEWVVKSNVITLDKGTSSLLQNTSAIQGSLIGTLTADLDLSEYGVTLPNDAYLPVVSVAFLAPAQEESFTLGISYYHNGTLTVRLKECTNTTYQANTVALTAVTLLIPQRYTNVAR